MRNGMRMALVMAFMVGCLPPGALARSSDPPEPVLWEDPAIVNNSSGIDENSSSDVSTSDEYGPRFIEVLRDDSFIEEAEGEEGAEEAVEEAPAPKKAAKPAKAAKGKKGKKGKKR